MQVLYVFRDAGKICFPSRLTQDVSSSFQSPLAGQVGSIATHGRTFNDAAGC